METIYEGIFLTDRVEGEFGKGRLSTFKFHGIGDDGSLFWMKLFGENLTVIPGGFRLQDIVIEIRMKVREVDRESRPNSGDDKVQR